jgi:acetylornithine/N-succinyldiaminopimelate aminotransferase
MRSAPHLMPVYHEPAVKFVEGQGCWLVDEAGRRYLDFFSGLAVTSLGHSHPRLVEALTRQARRLWHTSNAFENEFREPVAARLVSLLQQATGRSGRVFFCNSGAEAVECALKLARKATGRKPIACFLGSFHGRTMGALSVTAQPEKQRPFEPLVGEVFALPYGSEESLEKVATGSFAAVVVEAIQGEGGVLVPPQGFLLGLQEACAQSGALLVLDEVQTGLARTGKWFAFEWEGLSPDVVCMAKALGGGFPVGACWAREEVSLAFEVGDHGSTFGGNPLALSVVAEALSVLEEIGAPERAMSIWEGLASGVSGSPWVRQVRGRGALVGVELTGDTARAVALRCLEKGLVVNAVRPSTLRLAPPLVLSDHELKEGVAILLQALEEVGSAGQAPA